MKRIKLFILTDPSKTTEAFSAAQVLQEYDYDVINPRIIADYERNRYELGMYDDDHGWLKRDIGLMMRADAIAIPDELFTSSSMTNHERTLYEVAKRLPWIDEITSVNSWIDYTGANG